MASVCSEDRFPHDALLAEAIQRAYAGAAEELLPYLEGFRQYLDVLAARRIGDELSDKLSASDLVQDTLLTATQQIADFRGCTLDELLGWLRQILINHHRTARRRFWDTQKRDARRERCVDADADERLGQLPSRDDRSPSSHAALNESVRLLNQALQRLSARHRQIIELRQLARLSFAQISQVMEISEPAARQAWGRAIWRLERELVRLGLRPEAQP